MVETNNSINGYLCLLTQKCEGVILGFRLEVDENCTLLGYYTGAVAISYFVFLIREDGTDKLSRVGNKLPLHDV
jgi:hypothetical protein